MMNKTAHKIYSETRGVNQYEDVKLKLANMPNEYSATRKDNKVGFETTYKFKDGSELILCDRGYEQVVQLNLFA